MANPIVIAVDAMGGDFYEEGNPVQGALQALKKLRGNFSVILVGDQVKIERELGRHKHNGLTRLQIKHATQVITAKDHAGEVMRNKRDSSMHVGTSLVKSGAAAGFISAGNTGALMAISLGQLGRIRGVRRPALAATFPTIKGLPSVVLDVGANANNKPEYLPQFALLGKSYAQMVLNLSEPRVGLINIGSENEKGNDLAQASYKLLCQLAEAGSIVFSGNVEGNHVCDGDHQVIVTDGFTGNVVLKILEGIKPTIEGMLKRAIREGGWKGWKWNQKGFAFLGKEVFLRPTWAAVKRALDYARYGGAPFLGVNGVVIKAHGRSTPDAFMYAIGAAVEAAHHDMIGVIKERMAPYANSSQTDAGGS